MSIITLTTDYGNKDYFVSSLKAKIVSEIDSAEIIDISHNISPFNLTEAGYILEGAHKNFPKGTIHMICVDSELTPENKHIVIKHEESFFIGADNGVFSLIFKDIIPEDIFEINLHNSFNYKISSDDLFIKVLGHILRSGPLNVVGTKINKIKEIKNLRPVVNQEQNQIIANTSNSNISIPPLEIGKITIQDLDTDSDGVYDSEDNCPNTHNPNQIDENNNGIGDDCEDILPPVIIPVSYTHLTLPTKA